MPSKDKKDDGQTAAERQIGEEAQRLFSLAKKSILTTAPDLDLRHTTPTVFRRSDGADIIKRNTARKKRYLFLFPGKMEIPPGATIGSLSGLNTRTPVLQIKFPLGRLKLKGTLVFPKNAMIAVKGPKTKNRPVQVFDTFETLVVFSEWAWVGTERSNPGSLPQPLPEVMKGSTDGFWKTDVPQQDIPLDLGETTEKESLSSGDDISLQDSDGDNAWKTSVPLEKGVTPRSNPRRKRSVVNYAKLGRDHSENIDLDDDSVNSDEGQKEKKTKSTVIDVDSSQLSDDGETRRKRRRKSKDDDEDAEGMQTQIGDFSKARSPSERSGKDSTKESSITSRKRRRSSRATPILDVTDEEEEVTEVVTEPTQKTRNVQRRNTRRINYAAESGSEYGEDEAEFNKVDEDIGEGFAAF